MKIAITGTIGSGKTEVSNYIRSKGYYVFDADKTNSILLNKGNLGYLEVKKHFPEVFDGDDLNKARLASIVFSDSNKKRELESIMHPLILDEMNKESSKYDIFFAEIPLLFEVNWDSYFDISILVVSDDDVVIDRLVKYRGLTVQNAKMRIANQMSVREKIKRADEIIYNNSDLTDLYKKIDDILDKYVR